MSRGLFITGTDTGIGKTTVSVALLHALRVAGRTAVGMKPVASGCVATARGWRNDDALALQAASDGGPDYALVNPCALPEATAPGIAAKLAGLVVTLPPLIEAYRSLATLADVVVVEGVGGWLSPLAEGLEAGDLVRALDLDVVLVVGLRLGCINHARLSERAILADGCRLLGWVGNALDASFDPRGDYAQAVAAGLQTPCLGQLRHCPSPEPVWQANQLNAVLRQAGLSAG